MIGISCKELGVYFGGVSGALVTIMYKRIAEQSIQNRRFKRKIDQIRKQIFRCDPFLFPFPHIFLRPPFHQAAVDKHRGSRHAGVAAQKLQVLCCRRYRKNK